MLAIYTSRKRPTYRQDAQISGKIAKSTRICETKKWDFLRSCTQINENNVKKSIPDVML